MGSLDGKVALITGAARGQGRSHAIRLAQEGADVIAVDICRQIDSVRYQMGTPEDLAQTVEEVEKLDRRIVSVPADVRDFAALKAAVDRGVDELGRLDIVVTSAGIASYGRAEELPEQTWQDMIDTNLTGTWHTVKAAIPHIRTGGRGGSIILISSTSGVQGAANLCHYVAAKHGVVGLMRAFAHEYSEEMIRVNCLLPTTVNTAMVHNAVTYELFLPGFAPEDRTIEAIAPLSQAHTLLPVPWVESSDVSNAVVWLASDAARYVTGVPLPIDAGRLTK